MQVTADISKIPKNQPLDLPFILKALSESSNHFAQFSIVLAKKMLFSHKMVFIKSKDALLCITM